MNVSSPSNILDRNLTEAEARALRAAKALNDYNHRTPEDAEIFKRHLKRLLQKCAMTHRTPAETTYIVRRWIFDYMGAGA